jgi:hypothetical protein
VHRRKGRRHELLVDEELVALRMLADWLRQLRVAFGLRQASPGGLWAAITSGPGIGTIAMPASAGGDARCSAWASCSTTSPGSTSWRCSV